MEARVSGFPNRKEWDQKELGREPKRESWGACKYRRGAPPRQAGQQHYHPYIKVRSRLPSAEQEPSSTHSVGGTNELEGRLIMGEGHVTLSRGWAQKP